VLTFRELPVLRAISVYSEIFYWAFNYSRSIWKIILRGSPKHLRFLVTDQKSCCLSNLKLIQSFWCVVNNALGKLFALSRLIVCSLAVSGVA